MSQRLQEILSELQSRKQLSKVDFIDHKFPKQKELVLDTERFQAWNCTRRGAKSTSFAKRALKKLWENPGTNGLYLALTADSAKEILWKIIEAELDSQKISYRTNETLKRFTLSNGSELRFFGVDSSFKEMKKILGNKLIIAGIDEAGSMTIDMNALCYQIIKPALSDLQGDLIVLGTCENIPNTFFEKVIKGVEEMAGLWKKHIWTTYDNPYMAKIHHQEMEDAKRVNPLVVNASWFKTHYLNEWCADDELIIIKHSKEINEYESYPDGELFYCLGVDLGFNDASSFTVCAYSRRDPNLYVLESFKLSGMDFTDVATTIKRLQGDYAFYKIIVDGSAKQGVEELRYRHNLPLVAAEKTDKATFLRALNDDYKQGRVRSHPVKCKQLIDEQAQLMWLKDTDKEDPRCENHCNDSLLYAWRECKNYMFESEMTPWKSEEQKMLEQAKLEGEEMMRELNESSLF